MRLASSHVWPQMPRQHEDALVWSQRAREKPLPLQRALKADATKKHLSSKERCLVLSHILCWSCHALTRVWYRIPVGSQAGTSEAEDDAEGSAPSIASTASSEGDDSFVSFDTRVSVDSGAYARDYDYVEGADDEKACSKGFCDACFACSDGDMEVCPLTSDVPDCSDHVLQPIYYRAQEAMRHYDLTHSEFETVPESLWVTEWNLMNVIGQPNPDGTIGTWTQTSHIVDGGHAGHRREIRPNEDGFFDLRRGQV